MEDQTFVDNSVLSQTPAPATLEPAAPEPAAPEPAAPEPAQAGPPQPDPSMLEAILNGADPATLLSGQLEQPPVAAQPPQPAVPIPAEPRFEIPDKFKNPDGTPNVEALSKSYMEIERAFGEQGDRLGKAERQLQELFMPPVAPSPEEPKFPWEVEMTPEEKEKALEEFYADPLSAQGKRDQQTIKTMEHRMQKTLETVLEPLVPMVERHQYETEVAHYTDQLSQFAQVHPDIQDLLPEMEAMGGMLGREAIKAMEAAGKSPLEALYQTAKSLHKPAQLTPEQLINDPSYRQKILADPNIKNEILKSHVTAVKEGQPPLVIGAQPGGLIPATPSEKPKSVREATSMVNRWLRGQ